MTETTPVGRRPRAPAVSPERRRELIIESTLPLLLEHGTSLSTSQVARAAGIAEGTVFRAFKDKHELITACVLAAIRPDAQIQYIAALPPDLPVRERLVAVAARASDHLGRVSRLFQVLRASPPEHHHDPGGHRGDADPREAMGRLTAALSASLQPDVAALRIRPEPLARLFFGLVLVNQMQGPMWGGEALDPEELVDVVLHGVAVSEPPRSPSVARARTRRTSPTTRRRNQR